MPHEPALPMEWNYYTQPATRDKVDAILVDIATVFANLDHSYQSRSEAKAYEKQRLQDIADLDPHFAERCGWDNPDSTD